MPEPGKPGQTLTDPIDKICAVMLPEGIDVKSIPPDIKEKIVELVLAIVRWLLGRSA